MFNMIKKKLEDDYSLSNRGWSDNELMEKIYSYIDNYDKKLIELCGKNKDIVVEKIVEIVGEELLEI